MLFRSAKGAADAINYGSFSPFSLSDIWLSKVSVPGLDLPEDASNQVVEKELMTTDDYDVIIIGGHEFLFHHLV